jgi:hypothetical protein
MTRACKWRTRPTTHRCFVHAERGPAEPVRRRAAPLPRIAGRAKLLVRQRGRKAEVTNLYWYLVGLAIALAVAVPIGVARARSEKQALALRSRELRRRDTHGKV